MGRLGETMPRFERTIPCDRCRKPRGPGFIGEKDEMTTREAIAAIAGE